MAIASSSPLSYIQMVTKRLNIRHYFDKILSGENVKHPKPAPDVFLAAAEELELDVSEMSGCGRFYQWMPCSKSGKYNLYGIF